MSERPFSPQQQLDFLLVGWQSASVLSVSPVQSQRQNQFGLQMNHVSFSRKRLDEENIIGIP